MGKASGRGDMRSILLTLHSRNRFFAPPFLPFIDRAFIDAWF